MERCPTALVRRYLSFVEGCYDERLDFADVLTHRGVRFVGAMRLHGFDDVQVLLGALQRVGGDGNVASPQRPGEVEGVMHETGKERIPGCCAEGEVKLPIELAESRLVALLCSRETGLGMTARRVHQVRITAFGRDPGGLGLQAGSDFVGASD